MWDAQLVHATHILIALSVIATFTAALLFYLLAAGYTGKPWVGFVTAAGFLATHSVLNYAQSGTSYVPGMTCQVTALFLFERQLRLGREQKLATWLAPGSMLGLSILFWFPYILTAPSVLAFGLLYRTNDVRERARMLLRAGAVCAALVIGFYAVALVSDHITSFAMAHDWYLRSQYGKSQTRGYLRVITGIPRGFFWLGDDGVLWKRLLFERRAGAHGVGFALLILRLLWKLLAVYAFLLLVLIGLARSDAPHAAGRKLLGVLLIAAGPILFFAIVLFEAGPPERYLPVFPMLFLGAAHIVAYNRRRLPSVLMICFFGLMLAVNGVALSRAGSRDRWSVTAARLEQLEKVSSRQDVLFVISYQDDASRMRDERAIDPLTRGLPGMRPAASLQSVELYSWQAIDAKLILQTWKDGHQVWISKHLLAAEPKPDWNWVEGDDVRIHWRDFPAFFSQLQISAECCGEDGYLLLARTPENVRLLTSLAQSAPASR